MRIAIGCLLVLVFILYSQIIIARVDSVSPRTCEILRADGYLFDRFDMGRGDIRDVQGNIIASNVRAETILRICYQIDARPQHAQQVITCGGCAPQKTPLSRD